MTTDPLGLITDVNQQMELLTGRNRDELVGTPFKKYFTDPALAEEGIRRCAHRQGHQLRAHCAHQGGRRNGGLVQRRDLQGRQRDLQGVFAAARDITNRRSSSSSFASRRRITAASSRHRSTG
jgi:PAS domain S-box-containing protein